MSKKSNPFVVGQRVQHISIPNQLPYAATVIAVDPVLRIRLDGGSVLEPNHVYLKAVVDVAGNPIFVDPNNPPTYHEVEP